MNLNDVQTLAWQAVSDVPANPEAAFWKEWLVRKAGWTGPIGVPVADETEIEEGGTAQPFSSGVVLWWNGRGVTTV
jgi:uncharacterized protein with LGFP repeats